MPARRLLLLLAAALLAACAGTPSPSNGVAVTTGGQVPSMPETTASPIEEVIPSEPPGTPAPSASPSARVTAVAPPVPSPLAGPEWVALPTARKLVALTFDAGGNDAGIASILATLAAQRVPGTFFVTGRWVQGYPAQARRIAAAGHAIGNHTQDHPHLTALSDRAVEAELTQAEQAIRAITGRAARPLFRFPYGDSNGRVLGDVHGLGYGGIRWTVDTLGWQGRGAGQSVDTVVARALRAATPGEIVLMHVGSAQDGSTLDADALSRVISGLRDSGYGFVSVADFSGGAPPRP
jgi:peptidoglycan/xylan/chitin deacetylase (PgdA/CDA1 family)